MRGLAFEKLLLRGVMGVISGKADSLRGSVCLPKHDIPSYSLQRIPGAKTKRLHGALTWLARKV
ncbi:unnamed protein product, partial [marine sediment metagenome]